MAISAAAAETGDQPTPPPAPVTFEAYMAWMDDEDVRAEWVDGEIVLMSPNSLGHQDLVAFLFRLMVAFVARHRLGIVLFAPFLMRISTRPSGREPDLLFVAAEHRDRLKETYLDGPADLVVEIVSPESDKRDRGEKFVEYEAGGVREYWLLDPLRQEALFYVLGDDGRYHREPVEQDGVYRSTVLPGFWLRVGWLWERPLPVAERLLREIGA